MQWIKSHLTVVVCSSLSLVSVVMIVLAVFLTDVKADVEKDVGLYDDLGPARLKGVSEETINQAKRRREKNAAELEGFFNKVKQIGAHQPLLREVFEETDQTNRQAALAIRFAELYKAKQEELLGRGNLNAGGLPPREYVDSVERKMVEERANREQQAGMGLGASGGTSSTVLHAVSKRPTGFGFGSSEGLTPEQLVEQDPTARASVLWARGIYCYATCECLDNRPEITEDSAPPSVEEVWYAQVSLWIQEDVVKALAQLNSRVAEQIPAKADRWVGRLPVKHLVAFSLGSYVAPAAGAGAGAGAQPPRGARASRAGEGLSAGPGAVFTQRGWTKSMDVIRFELELVIDARQLLEVTYEICKSGLYTLLWVSYVTEPPNESLVDYIYGADPTIRVWLQFEACFLRSGYEQWMPEVVASKVKLGTAGGAGRDRGSRESAAGTRDRLRSPKMRPHR